jgi:hypothetical protein
MKTWKFAAVLLTALCSTFTLTSCLDSDDSNVYDLYEGVIVKESMGIPYLLGEATGNVYNPVSTSVLSDLKLTSGEYYKRAVVGIQLSDGQTLKDEASTYTIKGITVSSYISYKSFSQQVDTVTVEQPFTSFVASNTTVWARRGYVNVPFTLATTSATLSQFNLYAVEAKEDTLVTRLQFCGYTGTSRISDYISFEMPFTSADFSNIYSQLQPKNDSIVIKVTAKGENDTTVEATTKYCYTQR